MKCVFVENRESLKNQNFFVTLCDFPHLYIEIHFCIMNEEGVFMGSLVCNAAEKEATKAK